MVHRSLVTSRRHCAAARGGRTLLNTVNISFWAACRSSTRLLSNACMLRCTTEVLASCRERSLRLRVDRWRPWARPPECMWGPLRHFRGRSLFASIQLASNVCCTTEIQNIEMICSAIQGWLGDGSSARFSMLAHRRRAVAVAAGPGPCALAGIDAWC